jgi:hypothetical protein
MKSRIKSILLLGIVLMFALTACKLGGGGLTKPAQTMTPQKVISTLYPPPPKATAYAQQPAAGICASFDGDMVMVSINPDIPDPRCSKVRADQKITIINNTQNNIEVNIGRAFEADLAPGEKTTIDYPFSDYLYPGVHQVQVKPCCGFELWLEDK